MKKILKYFVPVLLVIGILASIGWYLMVYDRDFTRDILLTQARHQDNQGNKKLASWFYDLAYEYTGQSENVAIELAEQYKADGNYTKAEYTLTNAIADGGSADLYIALCKTFVEQDKLLDAVNMLDNIANPQIKAQLDALRPEAPSPDQEAGFYGEYISVGFQAAGSVYYTTTGEYPSVEKNLYAEPISLPVGETTIYSLTVGENGLVSPLSILTYTVGGVIEKVSFTDPAMEAAIRELLGVEADYELYTNDLWAVTEFTVPEEVSSYEDLQLLPYLQKLTIHKKQFSSLEHLSHLTDLVELDLSGCRFPADSLSTLAALPALEKLTLANCSLSTIAQLKDAPKLTYLDLSNNTLRNLEPLSAMPRLSELYLQHNAVTGLEALSSLSNLTKLDVSYNSVTNLYPLVTCDQLTWLNAGNNSIATVEGVNEFTQLTHLYLDHNLLENVYVLRECTNLVELNISNNNLNNIQGLSTLTALEKFDFSYNKVDTFPNWPEGSAISVIDGSHNLILSVNLLKNQDNLTYLYLDYNKLTTVDPLANCYRLVMVNVYGNEIDDVSKLTDHNIIVNYDPT